MVWHTQGSGKSLTMAFYAGRIVREPELANPTVVVLTDRNDLDDQLFTTFSRCADLLRQPPAQAESRADLRAKLAVESGGVVFTTIQKFFPEEKGDRHPRLSNRRNIVVIADEAHRSQYDFIDGYARHMRDALPNASFIGFTGTPIELADASTRAVFGDHISVYDIQRAVDDEATVPIHYESRLAELAIDETERPQIDPGFEEVTEAEEADRREKLKTKWAQLEAVVGAEQRVALIARDIVEHFESRTDAMDGKAMVVCMSRRICIDLYRELVRLRPAWRDDDDTSGALKVVMTGQASDPPDWQAHIGNKARREALAKRFRDPADPLRMVLVRDMWLTGFDAPSLHTMYVDKPMRGHGLMQAIARVNRVFRDKPGGLVVDYLGLAHELKRALATYTQSGGKGQTAVDKEQAVRVLLEKYEVCCSLFHGFDRSAWTTGSPADRLNLLPAALEHVLAQEDGKARCLKAVRELSQAFALAVPHPETVRIRDDVSLFQHVRSALWKRTGPSPKSDEELDHAVRQIVSRAGFVGGLPPRSARHAAAQPRGRAAGEAVEGRAGDPAAEECGAGALVRRDAGADDPPLPEPRDRGGAGARGADRLGPRDAGGERPRGSAWAIGRRAGVLRRARSQRQRGAGARRRDAAGHRPRTGRDRARQRDYRLDATGERPCQPSPSRQARPAEARLPAGQAGIGNPDGAGAGRGSVGWLGDVTKGPPAGAGNRGARTHSAHDEHHREPDGER